MPIASLLLALAASASVQLRPVPLPDGAAGIGFDDLRFAPALGRLLVPAGRSGRLDLLDANGQVAASIPGFSAAKAFEGGHDFGVTSADVGRGLLFATDRSSQKLWAIDPRTGLLLHGVSLAAGPDYVRFVAPLGEVWVTEPDHEQIEIFGLAPDGTPTAAAVIAVPGGPESLVIDAPRGRAYTNLWRGQTVAIDLAGRRIVDRWQNPCRGSRGIALDGPRGLLFVGCAEGKAAVLDLRNGGALVSTLSAGAGVDIIDYAERLHHLYLPGGKSATMAILGVSPAGQLSLLGSVPTAPGAHCVAADDGGHAFVCDPGHGRLLELDDPFLGRLPGPFPPAAR
ncbi:MAG: hypothetical protein ACYCWW_11365 [Deltaproteobacteria bacterium]